MNPWPHAHDLQLQFLWDQPEPAHQLCQEAAAKLPRAHQFHFRLPTVSYQMQNLYLFIIDFLFVASIPVGSTGTVYYPSSTKTTPCSSRSSTSYPLPSSANSTSFGATGSPTSSGSGDGTSLSSTAPYPVATGGNSTSALTGFPTSSGSGEQPTTSLTTRYPLSTPGNSTTFGPTGSLTSSGSGGETSLSEPVPYPTYNPPNLSSGTTSATSTADGNIIVIPFNSLLTKYIGLTQSGESTKIPSTFVTSTGTVPSSSSLVSKSKVIHYA